MKAIISNYAKNILKIDAIGFTQPTILKDDLHNYQQYLLEKNYGDMLWLASRKEIKSDPIKLLPEAKSVIIIGMNYFNIKPMTNYKISIYANQQQDYHQWVYKKIKALAKFLNHNYGDTNRYFVDTAPLLEKVLAKYTQIGWQGKHTCIVSRKFGSWLFLGVILTNLSIAPDEPHKNLCGTCSKCIKACPTQALSPYKLNTNQCISYHTIEHSGEIPSNLQNKFSNYIFGCDECLKVCPFNKWQQISQHVESFYNKKFPTSMQELAKLDSNKFTNMFSDTAIKRTGLDRLQRNILIAKNNEFSK